MPNGVMSFPSNHEFNVKTQIVLSKKQKVCTKIKNSGQNLNAHFEAISKVYYK